MRRAATRTSCERRMCYVFQFRESADGQRGKFITQLTSHDLEFQAADDKNDDIAFEQVPRKRRHGPPRRDERRASHRT